MKRFFLLMPVAFSALILPTATFAAESVLPSTAKQLVIVVGKDWDSSEAHVFLCEKLDSQWKQIGPIYEAVVGKKGMVLQDANQPFTIPIGGIPVTKVEGDMKAPVGLFKLGSMLGYAPELPFKTSWKYQQITETLQGVDDPRSKHYNQLVDVQGMPVSLIDWKSHEVMKRKDWLYKWLIVVLSNEKNAPRKGSMVFMHVWRAKGKGTAGCTALAEEDLLSVFKWLDPVKNPLIVQMPSSVYQDFQKQEALPVFEKNN